MQYKTGTVAVENGSATVTGTGTLFQTAAIPVGAPFVVVGHAAPYFVGAVNSETEIVLTAPYQGDTASGATYALVVDFTPHLGLPLIGKGDIETATILARALVEIDAQVNAIGAAGLAGEWMGPWSAGTYTVGQVVSHLGSAWICNAVTTTAEPGDSSGDWDLFAAKGEAGSAAETTFDNTASGLAATDVQEAIDETVARIDAIPDAVAMAIVFGS